MRRIRHMLPGRARNKWKDYTLKISVTPCPTLILGKQTRWLNSYVFITILINSVRHIFLLYLFEYSFLYEYIILSIHTSVHVFQSCLWTKNKANVQLTLTKINEWIFRYWNRVFSRSFHDFYMFKICFKQQLMSSVRVPQWQGGPRHVLRHPSHLPGYQFSSLNSDSYRNNKLSACFLSFVCF